MGSLRKKMWLEYFATDSAQGRRKEFRAGTLNYATSAIKNHTNGIGRRHLTASHFSLSHSLIYTGSLALQYPTDKPACSACSISHKQSERTEIHTSNAPTIIGPRYTNKVKLLTEQYSFLNQHHHYHHHHSSMNSFVFCTTDTDRI